VDRRCHASAEGSDVVVVDRAVQLDQPLLHPTRAEDEHDQQSRRGHRHDLDVAHRRSREGRVLHQSDLVGELGEQPHRPLDDVVEVDRAVEDGGDRSLLGRAHRLDAGEPVDEQPVALVGRDAPGAGVGLRDQPLLLQSRHVVAHGRGRDAQTVSLDQRLGADRLLGGDVVLDDRAEHGEAALVLHRHLPDPPRAPAGTQQLGVPSLLGSGA
jgi:hypothetical protein